jgi:hypothetical protein
MGDGPLWKLTICEGGERVDPTGRPNVPEASCGRLRGNESQTSRREAVSGLHVPGRRRRRHTRAPFATGGGRMGGFYIGIGIFRATKNRQMILPCSQIYVITWLALAGYEVHDPMQSSLDSGKFGPCLDLVEVLL